MDDDAKQRNLDRLYERRGFLDSERLKLQSSLDKHLLTLNAGGMYLSILFLNTLEKTPTLRIFLYVGLLSSALSIFHILKSIKYSQKAFAYQIDITDKEILQVNQKKVPQTSQNKYNKKVEENNHSAWLYFGIGLIFLILFFLINI